MSKNYELDKLRNILKDNRKEDVCLHDAMEILIDAADEATTLEQVNNKEALKRLKSKVKLAEKKCREFYIRLHREVEPEVYKK